jgi:hypothetical protein
MSTWIPNVTPIQLTAYSVTSARGFSLPAYILETASYLRRSKPVPPQRIRQEPLPQLQSTIITLLILAFSPTPLRSLASPGMPKSQTIAVTTVGLAAGAVASASFFSASFPTTSSASCSSPPHRCPSSASSRKSARICARTSTASSARSPSSARSRAASRACSPPRRRSENPPRAHP